LVGEVGWEVAGIFVDNGLMREGETEAVRQTFVDHFHADLHIVDARQRFLAALAGVSDPQEKRRLIGHVFIDVFKEEANRIENVRFLAQGTLYPDVIESGAAADGPAANIKTHHNVGGLPKELGFELIEPLKALFKDEVRRLGLELGLPETTVWRHPFPGPGLAVRCLGPVNVHNLEILRQADAILLDELKRSGWYRQTAQAFAVFLPVQSVGVMGDGRTYERVIAIRAVQTDDFMTADWSHLPYELLAKISTRIINSVGGVNPVVYDISSKPPATIEWEERALHKAARLWQRLLLRRLLPQLDAARPGRPEPAHQRPPLRCRLRRPDPDLPVGQGRRPHAHVQRRRQRVGN